MLSSLLQTLPWIADRQYRKQIDSVIGYVLKFVLHARDLQCESKRNNMLNPSLPLKMSLSRPVDNLDTKNLKEYFYVLVLPTYHRENGFTVAYITIFAMSFSTSC